jgi:hypothetical protein
MPWRDDKTFEVMLIIFDDVSSDFMMEQFDCLWHGRAGVFDWMVDPAGLA